MNAAQVRARARRAMERRAEQVEQDELESGEINLIPYLDIVTNLLLFMLISVAAGFFLGQISTTLPQHVPADQVAPTNPAQNPDEKPLQLIVSATKQGILLWSISGLEGTLDAPKARIPRLPAESASAAPRYDYQKLNDALYEIAKRHWLGKLRPLDSYDILLQLDPDIPYETLVHIMDAVRQRTPPGTKPGDLLPEMESTTEKRDGKEVVVKRYDPDKNFLFPNILFAKWTFD